MPLPSLLFSNFPSSIRPMGPFPLIFCFLAVGAFEMKGLQLNNTKAVLAVLETLPKECQKNGKKYKEGENFELGRLRYRCQKYGVYSIEGCRTEKNETLEIGESKLQDNILRQCLKSGNSVFYRETTCGTMGMPDCDKVPKPSGFEKAEKNKDNGIGSTSRKVEIKGLPPGWQVFEEGAQKIPGTNATLISRTLFFNPMSTHSRSRRQSGRGVGSVVAIEDPGTDKPPMPMEMLMKGATSSPMKSEGQKTTSSHRILSTQKKPKIVSTQDMRTSLQIHDSASFKPGSVGGSQSDVSWKGKTSSINGKQKAVGPGTFTFGNRSTGVFSKKP